MSVVYKKQVDDLELLVPNFKIASAIIHYDETSPHMHIVGVPIKEKNKNGMSKQVGKSDVFTKESLIKLQDNMRTLCIEEFNEEYNLNTSLKKKQKGRNRDIHVSDMDNYIEMKKQLEKNTESLEKANKKSLELKQNSKDIKNKIESLKVSKLNKDNYILSKEDKESFIDFINNVDNINKEYDKIQTLSTTLTNVDEQIKDKNDKIKTLTENNDALNLRINKLNNLIKDKDEEISFLKSKINELKDTLEYWQDKFNKIILFIHGKIHNWFDKDDKYIDVVNEMYQDNILDDGDINDLDLTSKEKDDFEI
ncbi:mobilization protein [Clostridium sp. CAG:914]|nr:mobilization protein [Clostridium sp. CAG:914]